MNKKRLLTLMGGTKRSARLILQPGATGIDTTLVSIDPTAAYGNSDLILLRGGTIYTGLIKFDLSSLAGLSIIDATLYVYAAGTMRSQTTSIYRVLPANSLWDETATWNAPKSGSYWAGDTGNDAGADAGCSVSGTDYSATLMGSFTSVGTDAIGTEYKVTLSKNEFAFMVASNQGICLFSNNSNDSRIASSEYATESLRPKLVVNYYP